MNNSGGGVYKRILNLDSILEDQSVFLLGPRQTGKSTFLKTKYPEAHTVDLLDSSYFRSLLSPTKIFLRGSAFSL
jgi:predicted AAA+ superfamily ATPase